VIDLISHNPRMVGELLSNEAHLLDIAEYPEWLSLYTADAEYWMPVDPGAADPADSLNIILDDRSRLEDRVAPVGDEADRLQLGGRPLRSWTRFRS
jgi:3-phenylpropionate/cinnamic acid dioxygenase small subunit